MREIKNNRSIVLGEARSIILTTQERILVLQNIYTTVFVMLNLSNPDEVRETNGGFAADGLHR